MSTSLATFEADAPTSDIVSALREDGGVILCDLIAEEVMDEVYAEILANTSSKDRETQDGVLWPEGNRTIGALAAVSPTYSEKLLLHPKILDVADGMLLPIRRMCPGADRPDDDSRGRDGDHDCFASSSAVSKNDAGSLQVVMRTTDARWGPNCHHYNLGTAAMLEIHGGSRKQILHRENGIYQPFIGYIPEMREFILSVNWAGTEFTLDNGATRLVPGSHKWPEDRIAKESEIAQAVMSKGSAVVWLSRTLHGSGSSTSTEGRTAFFASYVADWVRQEENQYVIVPPETAEKLSHRAQQVIGYRCSDRLGWVKGRSRENLLQQGESGTL